MIASLPRHWRVCPVQTPTTLTQQRYTTMVSKDKDNNYVPSRIQKSWRRSPRPKSAIREGRGVSHLSLCQPKHQPTKQKQSLRINSVFDMAVPPNRNSLSKHNCYHSITHTSRASSAALVGTIITTIPLETLLLEEDLENSRCSDGET
jgi:hypothetical protein